MGHGHKYCDGGVACESQRAVLVETGDIAQHAIAGAGDAGPQITCNHAYGIKPDGITLYDYCYKCGAKR